MYADLCKNRKLLATKFFPSRLLAPVAFCLCKLTTGVAVDNSMYEARVFDQLRSEALERRVSSYFEFTSNAGGPSRFTATVARELHQQGYLRIRHEELQPSSYENRREIGAHF